MKIVGIILGGVIAVFVGFKVLVGLWPTILGIDTEVQALTQTDAGTTMLQSVSPIIPIVLVGGFIAGIVIFLIKKFKTN